MNKKLNKLVFSVIFLISVPVAYGCNNNFPTNSSVRSSVKSIAFGKINALLDSIEDVLINDLKVAKNQPKVLVINKSGEKLEKFSLSLDFFKSKERRRLSKFFEKNSEKYFPARVFSNYYYMTEEKVRDLGWNKLRSFLLKSILFTVKKDEKFSLKAFMLKDLTGKFLEFGIGQLNLIEFKLVLNRINKIRNNRLLIKNKGFLALFEKKELVKNCKISGVFPFDFNDLGLEIKFKYKKGKKVVQKIEKLTGVKFLIITIKSDGKLYIEKFKLNREIDDIPEVLCDSQDEKVEESDFEFVDYDKEVLEDEKEKSKELHEYLNSFENKVDDKVIAKDSSDFLKQFLLMRALLSSKKEDINYTVLLEFFKEKLKNYFTYNLLARKSEFFNVTYSNLEVVNKFIICLQMMGCKKYVRELEAIVNKIDIKMVFKKEEVLIKLLKLVMKEFLEKAKNIFQEFKKQIDRECILILKSNDEKSEKRLKYLTSLVKKIDDLCENYFNLRFKVSFISLLGKIDIALRPVGSQGFLGFRDNSEKEEIFFEDKESKKDKELDDWDILYDDDQEDFEDKENKKELN